MGSWKGRGSQYIQFVRVLYCKLPTNGKQLPAFPLEAVPGFQPRPQRWEARVLPAKQLKVDMRRLADGHSESIFFKFQTTRPRMHLWQGSLFLWYSELPEAESLCVFSDIACFNLFYF